MYCEASLYRGCHLMVVMRFTLGQAHPRTLALWFTVALALLQTPCGRPCCAGPVRQHVCMESSLSHIPHFGGPHLRACECKARLDTSQIPKNGALNGSQTSVSACREFTVMIPELRPPVPKFPSLNIPFSYWMVSRILGLNFPAAS